MDTPSTASTPLAVSVQGTEHALHCVLTFQNALGHAAAAQNATDAGRVLLSHRAGSATMAGAAMETHVTTRAVYPVLPTPHGALHDDQGEVC